MPAIRFVQRHAIAIGAAMFAPAFLSPLALAQQQVMLDFGSGSDGSIVYTQPIRDAIQTRMEIDYQAFGVSFSQLPFDAGPFSTIVFNAGNLGGTAPIDFRNVDPSDNAMVNVDGIASGTAQSIIEASSNIGSHELGHLLGLRHGDAFGPIGTGLNTTRPRAIAYSPTYPGPSAGVESASHVMASPAINVFNQSGEVWLSERSAVKLQFSIDGTVIAESPAPNDSIATAQPIPLPNIIVPNTIETGVNAGVGDFSVDAVVVQGEKSISLPPFDIDTYSFTAAEGDLFNVEVVSGIINQRVQNFIDPRITIFDSTGALVPYFSSTAFNDDEFETTDSALIDLTIPADGTYFIQIDGSSGADFGSYELFVYRFNGPVVPEPAGATLILAACVAGGAVRLRSRGLRVS